jgi:4a-hydroxytetrahydrobiopterin dehydratase
MEKLNQRCCKPCAGGTPPLSAVEVSALLDQIPGWEIQDGQLVGAFSFKNYYHTTAFVNAVVYLAHQEDHHPDISFGYKTCTIHFITHSIGGLSENDFICAAKIQALRS